ncbi:MAG TPA: FecR domain-containing protein, partial [Pyrinomonadaceae bacterium]|nr:FecR domain-containing protein [Pyrinomonadaceae bacterium]
MNNKELDNILDQVTSGIHSEQVEDQVVNDASARVWARLSGSTATAAGAASPALATDHIEGCPDFQSLIPAYLAGQLSEARALLLVDHTHECIPCRRALKNVREGQVETIFPVRRKSQRKTGTYNLRPVVLRWGIAAALLVGLGLITLPLIQRYTGSIEATVQAADGPLYLVADAKTRALNVGEKIGRGDVIRTAKDGHAIVRLEDGSTIEMKDRSEVSLRRTLTGTTLHLDGGSVIIEATNKTRKRTVIGKLVKEVRKFFGAQDKGDFFVETNDSLVSVTGTTFAVNAGTKGSRVSVIEGEVHLDRNGADKV